MIEYDVNDSPFFLANQEYCKKLEVNFKALNLEYAGDCNSFGYEVIVNYSKGAHNYKLKCYKYQYTRNGIIIPVNAAEYLGIEITANGFKKNSSVKYGSSWWRRLFMNQSIKDKLSYPFYFKSNISLNDYQIQELLIFLSYFKIIQLNLNKGNLKIKIFSAFTNPVKVVEYLEEKLYFIL